jgi:Rrf2 family iron-sulfur cluster assembly transcriptional regulator
MRLTTKGRYAVTAMLDLAYLEQLFSRLRRQGLVDSARGPGGGYRLARSAADIAVVDVINAIDENVNVTRCGGQGDCQDGEPCLTHELWCDLSKQIHDFLASIDLQQLVDRRSVRAVSQRQDGTEGEAPFTGSAVEEAAANP